MWKFLNASKPEAKKRKTSDELRESVKMIMTKISMKENLKILGRKSFPGSEMYDQTHGQMDLCIVSHIGPLSQASANLRLRSPSVFLTNIQNI